MNRLYARDRCCILQSHLGQTSPPGAALPKIKMKCVGRDCEYTHVPSQWQPLPGDATTAGDSPDLLMIHN